MKTVQHTQDRIRKAFRATYRARAEEPIDVDALWQIKVMSHIRRLGSPGSERTAALFFNRYLWRLTPVVCLLIVVLSVAVMAIDFSLEYEITQFFMTDPVEFTVAQLLE